MKKLIILVLLISSAFLYSQDIKVYPNPIKSGSNLNIFSKYKITDIKIFNMEGKLVKSNFNKHFYWDYSVQLPQHSGFYIIQIVTEKGTTNKKIIVN